MADFNGVMPAQPSYLQQIGQLFAKKQAPVVVPPPAQPPTQATVDQAAAATPAPNEMSAMGVGIPMGGAVNLNKSKRTTTTDTPVYAKPEDQEKRMEALRQTPELQQAQKDQGDIRAQIQALVEKQKNRSTMDFSPLLALADSQTGGHQAAAYKKPEDLTPEIINGMQKLAAGDTGTLAALHQAMANQQVGQQRTTSESDTETGTKGASAGGAQGNSLKWHQQLIGDKSINGANDAIDASNKLQGLMAENTSMSDLMAKIQTLRASGLNRVTNFEISQMGGDRSLTERANQALQTLKSGNFTEGNKQELINAANILAQAAPIALKNKRDEYDAVGANAGIPPAARKQVLDPVFFRLNNQPPASAAYDGSTAPPPNATPEQKTMRLQYLQKKAQGG